MQVKGSEPQAIKQYIIKKFPDQYENWFNSLHEESREIYKKILNNKWYPFRYAVIEPLERINKMFFNGDKTLVKDIGAFNAELDLRGIYKVFAKAGPPKFMLEKSHLLFAQYYTGATMTTDIVDSISKTTKLHIIKSDEPDELHEIKVSGYITRVLEINGCINVEVDITKSIAKGDSETEFSIKWEQNNSV